MTTTTTAAVVYSIPVLQCLQLPLSSWVYRKQPTTPGSRPCLTIRLHRSVFPERKGVVVVVVVVVVVGEGNE